MATTNYYLDYGTGNDFAGSSFTDGAYTAATKRLVKAGAFAKSKVNHWLKLADNGSGKITSGYYRVASVISSDEVELATAPAAVDVTDVACVQHDGSAAKAWRSIQGALDLVTRNTTDGDRFNIKAGTKQVLSAPLTLATFGTPTEKARLILQGYTSTIRDGGMAEIDAGGNTMWSAVLNQHTTHIDLEIHSFGNNHGISSNSLCFHNCNIHKGSSSPSGKTLVALGGECKIINCYIHDAGTNGNGCSSILSVYNSVFYNCPGDGIGGLKIRNNLVIDCGVTDFTRPGIRVVVSNTEAINNTVYSSTPARGYGIGNHYSGYTYQTVMNNLVVGYSGSGGVGINFENPNGKFLIFGNNAVYNCETAYKWDTNYLLDYGNNLVLAADPFIDAANGNFALKPGSPAVGAAFNSSWFMFPTTTNKLNIGAVQSGGGGGGHPFFGDRTGGK